MSEWYYSERDERRGPVSLEELQQLIESGKVDPDELAWTEGMPDWKPIRLISELRPQRGVNYSNAFESERPAPRRPFDPDRDITLGRQTAEGYERDSYDDARRSRYNQAPHRGVLILILGIIGLLVCGFLAIPAVLMGKADLAEMKAGRMDSSGEGLTRAGYILGMIALVLMFFQVVLLCVMFGVAGIQP